MYSKSKQILTFGAFILVAISLVWLYSSGYPPVFEQIKLFSSPVTILLSRIASIIFLFISLRKFINKYGIEEKKLFISFLLLSPVYFVILTMYPLEALKFCSVIFLVSYFAHLSILKKIGGLFLVSVWILFITVFLQHQSPNILGLLSPKSSQETVNERFSKETVLSPNNYLPHSLKRIGYNKYFFLLKPVAEEMVSVGDLESIFFQEVHPLGQKSVPIFFWPQAIIFILALYFGFSRKNPKMPVFYYLLSVGTIYYLFSAGMIGLRLAFVGFSIFYLFSITAKDFADKPFNIIFFICVLLSLWGALAHISDRRVRPDNWFDNRPLIYKYGFTDKLLAGNNLPVYFSDHFGVGQIYCRYYRQDCTRFHYSDSTKDLFGTTSGIFIGFTGDYLGPNYDNFEKGIFNIPAFLKEKGISTFHIINIRDNILNQFGHDLITSVANTNEH